MEWSEIYTHKQLRVLLSDTIQAFRHLFNMLVWDKINPQCETWEITDEIEVAGNYGAVADKLVVTKSGALMERIWLYEADPEAKPPKPQYIYRKLTIEDGPRLIDAYKLTPRHFAEAERKIAQQTQETRRKKGLSPEEKAATVAALRALFESRACWVGSLLREITLGRSRCPTKEWWGGNILEYHYLIIDCYGIWESSPIGRGRIGRDHNGRTFAGGNLEELVELYDLSAEKLLKIKAMIEAE